MLSFINTHFRNISDGDDDDDAVAIVSTTSSVEGFNEGIKENTFTELALDNELIELNLNFST